MLELMLCLTFDNPKFFFNLRFNQIGRYWEFARNTITDSELLEYKNFASCQKSLPMKLLTF